MSYSTVMRSIVGAFLSFCVLVGSFGVVSGATEAETGRDDDLVSGLVVGGSDTLITEVPWQAALLNSHADEDDDAADADQFCGATVVSEEWLVTAAHCVDNGTQPSEVEVAVGKTSLFEIASSDRHQLREIVVSPSWDDSEGIGPDIALLRLAAPLVLDGVLVAAAQLPAEALGGTWPEIGHELKVSGWGCTAEVGVDEETSDACESSWPHHLQSVVIRDIAGPNGAAPCGDINPLAIAFTYEICAGIEAGGKDSCSGDSGGPLVSVENGEATLAGVVAWGFGCAQPGKPGIYTRVTSQRSWIDEVTGGITSAPVDPSFAALSKPERLLDTRSSGVKVGAIDGTGSAYELQVTGEKGVPSSGVAAVALNVTVVDGEAGDFGGFVTVYPCGTRPDASNLNFTSGQTIPNSVIAPVSSSGKVCFYVYGKAHLLADVSGYFSSGFSPLSKPERLLDTRALGFKVGELDGSGSIGVLQVTGEEGVPSTGVVAVALNVTVVDGEAGDFGGFVTVYPCGTRPDASNLNFTSGQTIPNSVIAPVSAEGEVCFYVYGKAHLLADVSGYFDN